MIYNEQTKKAMRIAFNAHKDQVDKAGVPYVFHPIHLAEQMKNEEEIIVALLHDTVEDSEITFDELEKEFSDTIMEALKLLTHKPDIEYMEYVKKIKGNPIARAVKIADLKHNSDLTRLEKVTEKDLLRVEKYRKALSLLMD